MTASLGHRLAADAVLGAAYLEGEPVRRASTRLDPPSGALTP